MAYCPHCGLEGHGSHQRAAGGDADLKAIADLTEQARNAPAELATLLLAARDRLRLERRGAGLVGARLARIYKDLIAAIRTHLERFPGDVVAERWARARINADWLRKALGQAGLNQLILDVEDLQVDLAGAATAAVTAGGVVAPGLDFNAVARLAQQQTMERYWRKDIVEAVADTLEKGLGSSMVGETLDQAIARTARDLNISTRKAKTEARTALSSFARAVTSASGAVTGAKYWAWMGPRDGVARAFCRELAGKVISTEQMGRLDNGQGLPVETAAGGYNCRHSAQPVSAAVARATGWPFATDAEIATANRLARRKR